MTAFRRSRRVTALARVEIVVDVDSEGNVTDVISLEPVTGTDYRAIARAAIARVDGYAEEDKP